MRFIHRYGFPLRRYFHHSWSDFQVWRQNREVAIAFRDPILEGLDLRFRLGGWLRRPWVPWAAGSILVAGLGLLATEFRWSSRSDDSAALSDVPASPADIASISGLGPAYRFNAGTTPVGGVPDAGGRDSSLNGVNTAILMVAAGFDGETDPAAAGLSAPARLPGRYNALVACKRDRTLYVYERKARGSWNRLAAFPMAFGRKGGDKADAGDRRTPEGRYWITSLLSGPSKGPLYGSLVFTLNYPTPRDLAEGKSGEGIWIHGVEAGKQPGNTQGCLSLANKDVLELAKYADIGTPIVILAENDPPDPGRQLDERDMGLEYPALMAKYARRNREDTLNLGRTFAEARAFLKKEAQEFPAAVQEGLSESDREAILARLAKWREDWSNRDTVAYAANFADGFRDRQGRDREEFLERKRRIFASKTRITMDMADPAIEPVGIGKANVTFRQDYVAEGRDGIQRSSESKTVWLERGPQGWLIMKE